MYSGTKAAMNRTIFLGTVLLVMLSGIALLADDGKLTIYMAGKPVASETYSVQKSEGKITIEGTGKAELGTMKIDIKKFKVVTDDKYHPLTASANASMGQMTMAGEITFAAGKAQAEMTMGQSTQHKETEVHDTDLVVNSNLPLFPWTLLAMRARKDTSDTQQFQAYIIGQNEVPVTVVYKGRESVEFADRKADLDHFSAAAKVGEQTLTLELWVNDDRKIIKLAAPSQNAEAYQEGWARKETEAPPAETKKP